MILRRIKHILLRLSTEEKVFAIGAIAVLVSAFMPWYSMVFNFNEKSITESGFSGDLGVIGFITFLLAGISLAFLMAEYMHIKLPDFGYKKDQILLFLMGENAFLILLAIAIYTKRSLAYTSAELRFGIYIALIGACISAFASFAQMQKLNKKDTEAFFDHSEDAEEEIVKETLEEAKSSNYAVGTRYTVPEEKPAKKQKPAQAIKEEQKGFFYDEPKTAEETTIDEVDEIDEITEVAEEPIEDEFDDKIIVTEETDAEEIKDQPIVGTSHGLSMDEQNDTQTSEISEEPEMDEIDLGIDKKSPSDQGNYFMRDAGIEEKKSTIKVDIDSIKPIKKDKQSEGEEIDAPKMSFYDDL